jgi:hypothetical protein
MNLTNQTCVLTAQSSNLVVMSIRKGEINKPTESSYSPEINGEPPSQRTFPFRFIKIEQVCVLCGAAFLSLHPMLLLVHQNLLYPVVVC